MASPSELAGQTERCPACESLCRVPRPAAAPVRTVQRPGEPVCQLCGGSMAQALETRHGSALRVLGGVAVGIGGIGLVSCVGLIMFRIAGVEDSFGPQHLGAFVIGGVFVLIGMALIGGRRKVWRCGACSTIVPRG